MPDIRKNKVVYTTAPSPADIQKMIADALQEFKTTLYAVGDVYLTYSATENPAQKFGGTWVRASKGRTLIGVDEDTAGFETSGKTGGSFSKSILTSNLPSHSHSIPPIDGSVDTGGTHTHTVSTTVSTSGSTTPEVTGSTTPGVTGGPSVASTGPASATHTHKTTTNTDARCAHNSQTSNPGWLWGPTANGNQGYGNMALQDLYTGSEGNSHTHSMNSHTHTSAAHTHTSAAHTHSVPALSGTAASNGSHTHTITIASSNTGTIGTDAALDITPLYETVYVWKRTA